MSFKTVQCPDETLTQISEWIKQFQCVNVVVFFGGGIYLTKDIDKLYENKGRKSPFRKRVESSKWGKENVHPLATFKNFKV